MSHTFLVELGTEELPPKSLATLSAAFTDHFTHALNTLDIAVESITPYASPRRLAILATGLPENTPTQSETVWGPPSKIAFDTDGKPSKAALAFAKKNGIAPEDLKVENDGKADKLVHQQSMGGKPLVELLPSLVNKALAALPISKRMRWGASRTEFVRPTQWLVMLFDKTIIPATILGQVASNTSQGHRFHCQKPLTITDPNTYATILEEQGFVIVDFDKRKNTIKAQVKKLGQDLGGKAVIGDDLLDEVTALVEWPVALAGNFEASFLTVPSEALISSMKEHQKYFHVVNHQGDLLPHFITISNIDSRDKNEVIRGNEKVIRPRLADAAFFFDTDKKVSLATQREKLRTVVFQAKLGSLFDKTQRIEKLSAYIANEIGANTPLAERAAQLCKSDLVTNMVVEFSDLQGIAGYYYALNDGEEQEVALALNEQYKPRYSGDTLASTATGQILAIADRVDTIVGIFGLGQIPKGNKDPFGLRRASLGVLRILVEKQHNLDLRALLTFASGLYAELPKVSESVNTALNYMLDRFASWYAEENIKPEVYQAVHAKKLSRPLDINQRVHAVAAFCHLESAPALAEANKRVSNILAKQNYSGGKDIDSTLFEKDAEKNLAEKLTKIQSQLAPLLKQADYTSALTRLADLREPVDQFFTDVMVMTDDEKVRYNRLALLQQLRDLFLEIADISYLVVKG